MFATRGKRGFQQDEPPEKGEANSRSYSPPIPFCGREWNVSFVCSTSTIVQVANMQLVAILMLQVARARSSGGQMRAMHHAAAGVQLLTGVIAGSL